MGIDGGIGGVGPMVRFSNIPICQGNLGVKDIQGVGNSVTFGEKLMCQYLPKNLPLAIMPLFLMKFKYFMKMSHRS